jgi:hypothetical protein
MISLYKDGDDLVLICQVSQCLLELENISNCVGEAR